MNPFVSFQLEPLSVLPGRLRWQVSGLPDPYPLHQVIEDEVRRNAGIDEASFNPLTARLLVRFDSTLPVEAVRVLVHESVLRVLCRPTAASCGESAGAPAGGHGAPFVLEGAAAFVLAGAATFVGIAATVGVGWAVVGLAAGVAGSAAVKAKMESRGGVVAVIRQSSPDLAALLGELAPLRPWFGEAIAYDVLGALAGLGQLLALGVAITGFAHGRRLAWFGFSLSPVGAAALLAGGAAVLTVLQAWCHYKGATVMQCAGRESQHRLRVRIFDHIQRLQMAGIVESAPGQLASLVVQDVNTLEWTIEFSNRLVQAIIEAALFLLALLFVQPWLGLLSLLIIALLSHVSVRVFQHLRPRITSMRTAEARLDSQVTSQFDGLLAIRVFNLEERERCAMEASSRAYLDTMLEEMPSVIGYPLLLDAVVAIGLIVGSVVGRPSSDGGGFPIGSYVSGIILAERVFNSCIKVGPLMNNILKGFDAYGRIRTILGMRCEPAPSANTATLKPVHGDILYENVSFSYNDGVKVLDDVTLRIPSGKSTAIVGLTGSGKSTLVNLLLGFYAVDAGRIFLDGVDLAQLSAADYRRAIAVVSQDIYLFDRSVRDNIAVGRPGATADQIIEAARAAEADDFIQALPRGYDTLLGKRGETLSGGQRQRIAIARAILRDAPILVLDEATSQLDNLTFDRVQRALERLAHSRTVIVVTHRMTAAKRADRCYVMEAGRVAEQGTHDELIHSGGVYSRLWE